MYNKLCLGIVLKNACDHIPRCKRKIKSIHWTTRDTIRNIRKRKRMFNVKMICPTQANIDRYKAHTNVKS